MTALLAEDIVEVQRMTKKGLRTFDVRGAIVDVAFRTNAVGCAILTLVVRHAVPAVRPDDVLAGLRQTADLATPLPPG